MQIFWRVLSWLVQIVTQLAECLKSLKALDTAELQEAMFEVHGLLPPGVSVQKTDENFQISIASDQSIGRRMSLSNIVHGMCCAAYTLLKSDLIYERIPSLLWNWRTTVTPLMTFQAHPQTYKTISRLFQMSISGIISTLPTGQDGWLTIFHDSWIRTLRECAKHDGGYNSVCISLVGLIVSFLMLANKTLCWTFNRASESAKGPQSWQNVTYFWIWIICRSSMGHFSPLVYFTRKSWKIFNISFFSFFSFFSWQGISQWLV